MHLQELIIYKALSEDPIIKTYLLFLEAANPTELRKHYFELVRALIRLDLDFETYMYTKMIEVDSPVLERMAHPSYQMTILDEACIKNDLAIISHIMNRDTAPIIEEVGDQRNILAHVGRDAASPAWARGYQAYFHLAMESGGDMDVPGFIDLLKQYGTGSFANYHVFYLNQEKALIPVWDFSPVAWDRIYDYERQKEALLMNTKALVEGRPFHHVILEGASGTGKSSCVKAVVDLYKGEKLRMIQLYKNQLRSLPMLLRMIGKSSFKFIVFIDDLSFEYHDDDYKVLKSYIEGGITADIENIAFYVTSNRTHLIKEVYTDRENDVHIQDAIQETTSLASRFGLHLTFFQPTQDEYFDMIAKMLGEENLPFDQAKMEAEAKKWAIRKSGRSGRTAMQFVKEIKMSESEGLLV